ncbi:hypothetical protein B0H34DRAFT_753214 [Crassisporium funariophilum]|nr:hypothetical protein B0H34DRAFT_753214 [Crassisporium funariophilum]
MASSPSNVAHNSPVLVTPRKRATSLPSSSPLSELSPPSSPEQSLLPPLLSDDLIFSSPITGTRAQRTLKARQKGFKKRALTFQSQEDQARLQALNIEQEIQKQGELTTSQKHEYYNSVIDSLQTRGYSLGDMILYVSDPIHKRGVDCWDLFRTKGWAAKVLDLWANQSSTTAREQVRSWAVQHVVTEVKHEAQQLTESKYLQTLHKKFDAKLLLSFSISSIQSHLQMHCSTIMDVLSSVATSARQVKEASSQRFTKKLTVVTSAALALLGEYSYSNNWAKKAISLYLYSSGSQRQPLSVLSHLGLGESYDSIVSKNRKRKRKKKKTSPSNRDSLGPDAQAAPAATPVPSQRAGSLRELSNSMIDMACVIASTGLFATSYDNINMVFKAAEQIVGRTDAQENGTCATIWRLYKAAIEDIQVVDLEASFAKAPPLSITDVLLSSEEAQTLSINLWHCILRIIVTHGGEGFKKFLSDLNRTLPCTDHKIEIHKTPLHPLPAFDIDESTIIGGAEVVDKVFEVLQVKAKEGWSNIVKFFCGDQLTIARLRALLNIRAGHEGGYSGFGWGVWMPGLFHAKMADTHGGFLMHWGKAAAGPRNPGCLAFHNTILQRKPILTTSLPPFQTLRDLIFTSLYARVLHCLLVVSKTSSLAEYLEHENLSWSLLEHHAQMILNQFANADIVADLRWKRARSEVQVENSKTSLELAAPNTSEGDMVFENAILFLRDALLSREFTDAIKGGDSGRVMIILKTWALSFRGSGRTKYAHEMLHLIHNVQHVWPKKIHDIVFDNWLVNPSGMPNSWVEVDLMQEHMNFWIKNFYRAHGSAASWEWLEMIAPCVEVLRDLARNFKMMLGSDIGTAHHTMDLSVDIPDLMSSLHDHEVYEHKRGRKLDLDDLPVPDIVSTGCNSLFSGKTSPLKDYNTTFQNLQARRRLVPLVGGEKSQADSQVGLSPQIPAQASAGVHLPLSTPESV